jgi:UDP-N-acetylmuramate dehydrogenase
MIIQKDIQLSDILWYKIGGKVKYLLTAENKKDVIEALEFIKTNNIQKIHVLGLGSNLIFSDDYFDGAVMQIATNSHPGVAASYDRIPDAIAPSKSGLQHDIVLNDNGLVEVFAGTTLDSVINFAFNNNLTGLEWAGGLPGTVGAAVRGNVGAFGGEIKDIISSAEILKINKDNTYTIKTFSNQELKFIYRGSIIKENKGMMIILSAQFKLSPANYQELAAAQEKYFQNIQYRNDHHPLEYPSCGSVFKNIREPEKIAKILKVYPEINDLIVNKWHGKVAVGYLIQKLGLQGLRIGDAQISTKHALFIVNLGNAKAKDVLAVIQTIQTKIIGAFGFSLDPEVEIVK